MTAVPDKYHHSEWPAAARQEESRYDLGVVGDDEKTTDGPIAAGGRVMATVRMQPPPRRDWKSMKPLTRTEGLLAGLALVLTGISPNLLTLDLRVGVPMSTTAPVLLPFTVVAFGALYLYARKEGYRQIATLLVTGILLGATSTLAYDAFRLGGHSAGFIAHDEAQDFGAMIAGTQP
jgi:hypothetical protein